MRTSTATPQSSAVKSRRCKQCGRGREFRGFLTILITLLTFGLAYIKTLRGDAETVAPWVAAILGSVISMYFQAKGGERMREMTRERETNRDLGREARVKSEA